MTHFVGYCDNGIADDIDISKSMSGTMFFLSKCLVSCNNSGSEWWLYQFMKLSTSRATSAATQALWLSMLLGELHGKEVKAVESRVDSKSAPALTKNPVFNEGRLEKLELITPNQPNAQNVN